MQPEEIRLLLLETLTDDQRTVVTSQNRRVLVVAGAGSGKTEVMARRIAWWVGIEGIPKDRIVAFTFTDKAADEMKFRIRSWIERISDEEENASLGGMYVGTIHGFCLQKLREYWPDEYHNYEVIDEPARAAFLQRGFHHILGLQRFRNLVGTGHFEACELFLKGYDILQENNLFDIELPEGTPPIELGQVEREYCRSLTLNTDIGDSEQAQAFAIAAARYYGYLKCRRFLDFSTSQRELISKLQNDGDKLILLQDSISHLVVDEVQDINPVQLDIINSIVGTRGILTAVGDHRQAIFAWRGGRVDIIANMRAEIIASPDGEIVELTDNFRSTNRIIDLANVWAQTIGEVGGMETPDMTHGNIGRDDFRLDYDPSHVCLNRFDTRRAEAQWIANTINRIVTNDQGIRNDTRSGQDRGISYSDVAILLRSSTDARLYMERLEAAGIPAIFRAGPDLFSQPEVLLVLGALAITANIETFIGNDVNPKSLPRRIATVLGCDPIPTEVINAAIEDLSRSNLITDANLSERLINACSFISQKIQQSIRYTNRDLETLNNEPLKRWLRNRRPLRRVFPQQIYHMLLAEIGVSQWDLDRGRGATAMFHLGTLSSLVMGLETPGWTSPGDYHFQIIGLFQYGSSKGRTEEAPFLVPMDAVTISTIHGVKGLEFSTVFLADVCASRFPSNHATRHDSLPFDQAFQELIHADQLADNRNYDGERRLMYVAITRAERYLFISASGDRQSRFFRQLGAFVEQVGGVVNNQVAPLNIELLDTSYSRDLRLSTSFSDLRYYLECSHDFYLRKVLGFVPTISQAFGYGKGIHNLLRAIHSDPSFWARIANQGQQLEEHLQELIDRGLFYLRYTTADPAENMRQEGKRVVADYVRTYVNELETLQYEPEKEFETLLEEEQVLISGAIDVIRLDDPPRVTLIDFKSGNSENNNASGLDQEEMRLQIALYGHAAIQELEFVPERGLVRYLGEDNPERRELDIDLSDEQINQARLVALNTARSIKGRRFFDGPGNDHRCENCDFNGFCGLNPRNSE